jgi:hypothetical protein
MENGASVPSRLVKMVEGELTPKAQQAISRLHGVMGSTRMAEIISYACKHGMAVSLRVRLDAQGRIRTNISLED